MPMAGEGSRFLNAGWNTPKPLIELDRKPLFLRAIGSVKIEGIAMKYSFIVRQNHIEEYTIDKAIKEILPEAMIYAVEKTTRGAVETCLKAEEGIADDDAVVIMDCDLEFTSEKYTDIIRESLSMPGDKAKGGALVSFESDSPKYSYAEISGDGLVKRTAEKEVISNHALCGAYFFASGKEFKKVAHELVEAPMEKPELYVSLLYNKLLESDSQVKIASMEMYRSYGTPEEISKYL